MSWESLDRMCHARRTVMVDWELKSIRHVITDENRIIPNEEAKSDDLQGKGIHILDMPDKLWSKLSHKDWQRCQAIWDQETYARQCRDHHSAEKVGRFLKDLKS